MDNIFKYGGFIIIYGRLTKCIFSIWI